jgi:hypothetical protein
MSLPPPGSKPMPPPPLPPPKPAAASAPLFDAFGLGAMPPPPPPPQPAAAFAAFAVAPPRPQPSPAAAAGTADLLNLLDAPAPSGFAAPQAFGAFPGPAVPPAPPAPALDFFSSLAAAPPAAMDGRLGDASAPGAPVDPFALLGLSSLTSQPSGGMRPPALGASPALGGGGGAPLGTPARKPATLDETLSASLANLAFSRP